MRRILAVFAVLLVISVAVEVLLRTILIFPSPGNKSGVLQTVLPVMQQIEIQEQATKSKYVADPDLGALLAPGRLDVIETPEFTYTRQTDHAGFPNQDPWPNKLGVAVLGDSLLIGAGVGFEGRFTTLLERKLNDLPVLNLGIPGAGTEHQLHVYRKYIRPLSPKVVVTILWITWDIDNSLQFDRWRSEKSTVDFTQYRYTFGDTHPSNMQRNHEPESSGRMANIGQRLRDLAGRSYALKALYLGVKSLRAHEGPIDRVELSNGNSLLLASRDQRRLAQGLDRPAAPDMREVFFRPLVQLMSEVQEDGGQFVVVLVPSKEELYAAAAFPDVLRSWREVKIELEARQLPTLDLYPVFHELGQDPPAFYRLDSHLNQLGNQIVADALAQWIADKGVRRPDSG